MTPTIGFKNENFFFTTGSPGGAKIISAVLQSILNMVDYDMNVEEATKASRIHHQWQPDKIQIVPGLPKTRSGKIMRRILRKVASNEVDQLGDTSTLLDPSVVDAIVSGEAL